MIKKIAVVSLSRGVIGEDFVAHEIKLGEKRIKDYGVELVYSNNAMKGLDYISNNPEKRAQDLIDVFKDDSVDMILCAVGGDDTYRLLPYLFDNDELKKAINNKIFLGFSDTTWNHFMLNKLGFETYYGQAYLPDVCELYDTMLEYTKKYFEQLISTGTISEITPSDIYYESREDFSVDALGTLTKSHLNEGFKLLQGTSKFSGKIFGGCLDSIYDMFNNERYADTVELTKKYNLFPDLDYWKNKILFIETSEEEMSVDKYRQAITYLKQTGIFDVVSGVLMGKPYNDTNRLEYEKIIMEVIDNKDLPIVSNINVGHCLPRAIIPFNKECVVDVEKQIIKF